MYNNKYIMGIGLVEIKSRIEQHTFKSKYLYEGNDYYTNYSKYKYASHIDGKSIVILEKHNMIKLVAECEVVDSYSSVNTQIAFSLPGIITFLIPVLVIIAIYIFSPLGHTIFTDKSYIILIILPLFPTVLIINLLKYSKELTIFFENIFSDVIIKTMPYNPQIKATAKRMRS